MLKKETIDYIIRNRKFEKTFDDYLSYVALIFPIGVIVIGCTMMWRYARFNDSRTLLFPAICVLVFGLFALFFVSRRLNQNISFICLPCTDHFDLGGFGEKLKTHFRLANIHLDKHSKTIIAVTKMTAFSWGEQLTVIVDKDCVLVNSRPNGQPITIVKDSQNIKRLRQLL